MLDAFAPSLSLSRGEVQGDWKCADHEAELLQDYLEQSILHGHRVLKEGAELESERWFGESVRLF